MKPRQLLLRCDRGDVANIRFADMQRLLEALGFSLARVNGSHHIFRNPSIAEQVNLQDAGGEAKPYQIRQVMALVDRYALTIKDKQ